MNYRHAYHAGNFADCMKHALLTALVGSLTRKATLFAVLDTHAGIGGYDLAGVQAEATGEWRDGIGRLLDIPEDAPELAPLRPWLDMVRASLRPEEGAFHYPGSPELVARLLRPQDELVCCELHPEDQTVLRRLFRNKANVSVHHRDGYEAIGALLPPRQARRGLTLIDPPFERTDEFARLAQAVTQARTRFSTGMVAAWYPIKHGAPVRAFLDAIRDAGLRDVLNVEFTLRPPLDPSRLNGCGLLVVQPPYQFDEEARSMLEPLCRHLGDGETQAKVEWVAPE
ncbi:23S rRNA (adenine(2030)-N(6))-methyltransferase RlmJ [Acetobacter sacchari]|uniref:Ribosomal RNA large subunit methyltransferase J n=1 Tax=Acetobacter sacchari TaxID=2661687 RepID=A0ABS3LZ72_9PROT|nr:23S rRNA (adenine(2030)-N(6))-methyltransferase RlmJ [Acetobacter sacchari]